MVGFSSQSGEFSRVSMPPKSWKSKLFLQMLLVILKDFRIFHQKNHAKCMKFGLVSFIMISEFVGPGFGEGHVKGRVTLRFFGVAGCLAEEKWCLRSYSHENQTDSKLRLFEYEKSSFFCKVHVLVGN